MADSYIQGPADGAGKKVQTVVNTVGGDSVHAACVCLVDKTGVHLLAPGGTEVGVPVCGTVAHAGTDSGSPVKVGGVYNSTAPSLTSGQRSDLQVDSAGNLKVVSQAADSTKTTYSASSTGIVPAASATDIWEIIGSGTKTIRVYRIAVSGVAGTATTVDAMLIKRSTATTAASAAAATKVPHDSSDAAASNTVRQHDANPSALGTSVGTIRSAKLHLPLATSIQPPQIVWEFGGSAKKAPVLRGVGQSLNLNLNTATVSSGLINVEVEWTEE